MESCSFTVENTDYICIGPFGSALRAKIDLDEGAPLPSCWNSKPQILEGGTVLVNDVDMRVPVLGGKWTAEKLFNKDIMAGGMIWHESVGEIDDAVNLFRDMENAGGVVICNIESEAILNQGIRYIGRYSWKDRDDDAGVDAALDNKTKYMYPIFGGPTCCFMTAESMKSHFLPDILRRLDDVKANVDVEVAKMKAENEESYEDEFLYRAMRKMDAAVTFKISMPPISCDEKGGVCFTFRQHEYLFGRLWFDSSHRCKAFSFITYAAPEFYATMRLGDRWICPRLGALNLKTQDNDTALLEHLAKSDSEEVSAILNDLTEPYRHNLFHLVCRSYPGLVDTIFGGGIWPLTMEIFSSLFIPFMPPRHDKQLECMEKLLKLAPPQMVLDCASKDAARYLELQKKFQDGTYPFHSIGTAEIKLTKESMLALYIEIPSIFKELLRLGVSARHMLGPRNPAFWYMTILSFASLKGMIDVVDALLEYGADVDEVLGDDPWNSIVYSCLAPNHDEMINYYRAKFPNHVVWSRNDLPLSAKKIPRPKSLFGNSNVSSETEKAVEELGTIEAVIAHEEAAKREKEAQLERNRLLNQAAMAKFPPMSWNTGNNTNTFFAVSASATQNAPPLFGTSTSSGTSFSTFSFSTPFTVGNNNVAVNATPVVTDDQSKANDKTPEIGSSSIDESNSLDVDSPNQ